MCVFRFARGAMFPLVAFVATQVNAEAECPSLLTLTRQSKEDRIPFQDNECGQRSLLMFGNKQVRDNALTFKTPADQTIYLSVLSFQGVWYSVTEGQPVDPMCLTLTDSTTLHFKAGRHGSNGVADVFMKGNTAATVSCTDTDHPIRDFTASNLN